MSNAVGTVQCSHQYFLFFFALALNTLLGGGVLVSLNKVCRLGGSLYILYDHWHFQSLRQNQTPPNIDPNLKF